MQKFWMILLAVLLATGMVVLGCDSGGGGKKSEDPITEFYLVLDDNFQYGEGYQGQIGKSELTTDVDGTTIAAKKLFDGNAIKKGDTYELAITFTASRDLEDALWAGLVDTVTGYWNPLSWEGDNDDDDGTLIQNEGKTATDIIKAGDVISGVFKFTALESAPSSALAENVLNFQTEGEPSPGTTPGDENPNNSGVKGPVTLTFTEFVFSKTNGETWSHDFLEAEAKQPPAPPPTDPLSVAVSKTSVVVTNTTDGCEVTQSSDGKTISIENKLTNANGGFGIRLPSGWDAYTTLEIGIDLSGDEVDVSNNTPQLTAKGGDTINSTDAKVTISGAITMNTAQQYITLNGAGKSTISVPTSELSANGITFQVGNWKTGNVSEALEWAVDIEITSITLKP